MATLSDFSGKSGFGGLVPAIGSYLPITAVTLAPSAADAVANTLTVNLPGLVTIVGVLVDARTTAGLDVASKTITFTGNSLTIAYADIVATDVISVLAWGIARA